VWIGIRQRYAGEQARTEKKLTVEGITVWIGISVLSVLPERHPGSGALLGGEPPQMENPRAIGCLRVLPIICQVCGAFTVVVIYRCDEYSFTT
jgi:hypothetical protein